MRKVEPNLTRSINPHYEERINGVEVNLNPGKPYLKWYFPSSKRHGYEPFSTEADPLILLG